MFQIHPPKTCTLDLLFDDDDDVQFLTSYNLSPRQRAEMEVQKYREAAVVLMKDDPLIFWKNNEKEYPCLSTVAQDYLVVQATSVASERVFSTAGDIVCATRSCLSPDVVDSLILLKKNMDMPN